MQPIDQETLKQLIEEAKKAGKDVSALEKAVEAPTTRAATPAGETKEKTTARGVEVIESTGPAREEDFQ